MKTCMSSLRKTTDGGGRGEDSGGGGARTGTGAEGVGTRVGARGGVCGARVAVGARAWTEGTGGGGGEG